MSVHGLFPAAVGQVLLHPRIAAAPQVAVREQAVRPKDVRPEVRSLLSILLQTLAPRAAREEPWLSAIVERIAERPGRRPSLQDLSEQAGVHPMHLTRTFRRRRGCSIGEFHRRMRVDAAVRTLLMGPLPLAELALTFGYCDQSHFTHEFVRFTGTTPARVLRAFAPSDRQASFLQERRHGGF
jgi:AraC family transcriptional regulator